MRKLFRQEAIDAQREKLLGEVSIARPVPTWVFTALALAFAALIVGFMFWASTRGASGSRASWRWTSAQRRSLRRRPARWSS